MEAPDDLWKGFTESDHACLLLTNGFPENRFSFLLATGSTDSYSYAPGNPEAFPAWLKRQNKTVVGHIAYDHKNRMEQLQSKRPDHTGFPELFFFVPDKFQKSSNVPDDFFQNKSGAAGTAERLHIKARTSREKYLETVSSLIHHIHRGDSYEVNYCIEFFSEKITIDPVEVFFRLNSISGAPFSSLYKCNDSWLLCASPERFLSGTGNKLISQPIKGTRPRGKTEEDDERLRKELQEDPKEKSENVMIVDLVRNDLSRIAEKGSVCVDELCGIYSFATVHQMISTISASIKPGTSFNEILKTTFPMGSMTGAPKIRAMQLIEEYEEMRRGIYSGAVGYITPEGDFDFNVVIRSIEYNAKTGYLSFKVGSAITAASDPEKEYEECLVKAKAMMEALNAVLI